MLVHSSAKILYSLHPRIEFPIGIVRFFFLLFFLIEYRVVILFYLGRMFFQAPHSVGDYRLVKHSFREPRRVPLRASKSCSVNNMSLSWQRTMSYIFSYAVK